MAFPADLTNFVDYITVITAAHLNALEAKIGVDASTAVTSLDYLLKNPASVNPGHQHSMSSLTDVSAAISTSINAYDTTLAATINHHKHSKLYLPDGSTVAVTIDASGKLGLGTDAPQYRLHALSTQNTQFCFEVQNDNANPGLYFRRAKGNLVAIGVSQNIGECGFYGWDGAAYQTAARIVGLTDGTVSSGITPGKMTFYTTDLTGVSAERMRLTNSGQLALGTPSPNAAALLHLASTTKGFLPPAMTTAQKNAISSPPAGLVVFDTTLGKLCVYSGGWQTVTSA